MRSKKWDVEIRCWIKKPPNQTKNPTYFRVKLETILFFQRTLFDVCYHKVRAVAPNVVFKSFLRSGCFKSLFLKLCSMDHWCSVERSQVCRGHLKKKNGRESCWDAAGGAKRWASGEVAGNEAGLPAFLLLCLRVKGGRGKQVMTRQEMWQGYLGSSCASAPCLQPRGKAPRLSCVPCQRGGALQG